MPLQFRHGKNSDRTSIIPAVGEPLWTTDTNALFVGDGVTPGGLAITGGGGTGTYALTTSSLINAGAVLHLNNSGSLDFPNSTILSTTTLSISSLGTVLNVSAQGLSISTTGTDATHAALFINESNTSTPVTPSAGAAIWAVGQTSTNTRLVLDNYGVNDNIITGRAARGTVSAATATISGDTLLRLEGIGYGANTFGSTTGGYIDIAASETFTNTAKGSQVNIVTVNAGGITTNTSLTVASNGTTITAPLAYPNRAALVINQSGGASVGTNSNDGTLIWGINKPGVSGRILLDTFDNTASDANIISARRARGTLASPTGIQSGDALFRLNAFGHNGSQFATSSSAYINFIATENFTGTHVGTAIQLSTTGNGTTGTVNITTINSTGIQTQSVNASVDIDAVGDINSGNNLNATNNVLAGGNVTAGINVTAGTNITATNGNISATNGNVSAGANVTAGGSVVAGTYLQAGSYVTATTNVFAGNNITAVGTLKGAQLTLTALSNAATGYILSVNTSSGAVTYRDYTPFSISTITNQALFTTSSVTFAQLTVTNTTIPATGSAIFYNATSGTYPAPPNSGQALWAITNNTDATRVLLDNYSTSPSPFYNGRAGRGTAASPSAVQAEDVLVSLRGNGYGTTKFNTTSSGYISIKATENFTDTANGAKIQLWANPEGVAGAPNLLATFRNNGTYIYTTATNSTTGVLTVVGSGVDSSYQSAYDGTLVFGVNKPNTAGRFMVDTYADPNAGGLNADKSYFTVRRARGQASAPTAVQNGDALGRLHAFGYATSGFLSTASAGISFYALENFTNSAAGGQIAFDTQTIGSSGSSTQVTVATIDVANGLSINSKITFADTTVQTTAWTGTVAYTNVTGLSTVAHTGSYNDLLNLPNQPLNTYSDVTFHNIVSTGTISGAVSASTLTANGYTSLNAGATINSATFTNAISVGGFSSLNGGATISAATITNTLVATGYASLNGGATISAATVTNNLTVGANLTAGMTSVGGLSVTTGTKVTQVVSAGGYPLDANGQALITVNNTQTPAMVVSNYTSGIRSQLNVRSFGQNFPAGGATTAGQGQLVLEGSRGTGASPTATGASDTFGVINFGGYDGTNWLSSQNTGGISALSPVSIFAQSAEAFANNGTTTTNAGSNLFIRLQPVATQLNSTSRRIFFATSWTAGSTATLTPPQLNLGIGQAADLTTPTLTPAGAVGSFGTGSGAMAISLTAVKPFLVGVTGQDTGPENAGITGTNILTFATGRNSATSGRRNALATGDSVMVINANAQTAASGAANGTTVGSLTYSMLEAASTTTRGTSLSITTVNTGTTTSRNRLLLTDRLMTLSADQYQFNNGAYTKIPLTFSTSTWNSSIDTMTFQDQSGTFTPLKLDVPNGLNSYNNTTHTFKDKSATNTALSITTATAVFTAIPVIPTYTKAQANAITGQSGAMVAISDASGVLLTGGAIAYWDTTNSRWSYIQTGAAL